MSRTPAEIYDALNANKASFEELNTFIVSSQVPGSTVDTAQNLAVDAASGSKVAIWRLWLWIMAVGSWTVEVLFDRHKLHIEEILSTERPHTLRWYSEESKKYQNGYAMIWSDNKFNYATDDPDARIVKYAAASERNGKVILKVAKDSAGVKSPLTGEEKTAFTEFWSKWKDAGVKLEIVSQQPDVLKVNMIIIRDRPVLDADNNLIRDGSANPILAAIQAFGQALEFDGILRLSRLVDAIQAAEGVVDVKITNANHRPAGSYPWSPVNMYVESVAGYFELLYDGHSNFIYQDDVEASVFD